ncbi:MAG: hypothetical protein ACO3AY_06350 [Chitinophagaceae bacterium]
MSTLRIVQYFELLTFSKDGATAESLADFNDTDTITLGKLPKRVYHRYQNYFVNQSVRWPNATTSPLYAFAPFQVEGTISTLGGDNSILRVMFPSVEVAIRLVEQGNGNRLSRLTLSTVWLNENLGESKKYEEKYIGIGAAFSETTIELRFRSAMDSVGSQFPARKLSRSSVGLLPLSADLSLR